LKSKSTASQIPCVQLVKPVLRAKQSFLYVYPSQPQTGSHRGSQAPPYTMSAVSMQDCAERECEKKNSRRTAQYLMYIRRKVTHCFELCMYCLNIYGADCTISTFSNGRNRLPTKNGNLQQNREKMAELLKQIKNLATTYSTNLKSQIEQRKEEMKADDTSHYLIYRVFGIAIEEGQLIDDR
jgi:hypothetical protein